MPAKKSFENPLIPHARMRALYQGLVETRVLGERLGRERSGRARRLPRGLEACWVATAIDLHEGDLVFDPRGPALTDYLRSVGRRSGTGYARPRPLRELLESRRATAMSASERILCATGAAMAMKHAGNEAVALVYLQSALEDAGLNDAGLDDGGLAAGAGLARSDWKRLLPLLSAGELPLVLVSTSLGDTPRSHPGLAVIPVDAADTLAIYRVAQESLLRARAEGGTVLIECAGSAADPIAMLARQLQTKRVATPQWIKSVEPRFRALLERVDGTQQRKHRTDGAVH